MDQYHWHNPGASHTAALVACVLHTKGPILEFGVGAFSTPLLHAFANFQQRPVVSLETDPTYIEPFLQYRSVWHEVIPLSSYDDYPIGEQPWSVVLIDHLPCLRRSSDLLRMRDHAQLIVAHDTEDLIPYGYNESLTQFKYRFDYRPCPIYTTVVSETDDLTWLKDL